MDEENCRNRISLNFCLVDCVYVISITFNSFFFLGGESLWGLLFGYNLVKTKWNNWCIHLTRCTWTAIMSQGVEIWQNSWGCPRCLPESGGPILPLDTQAPPTVSGKVMPGSSEKASCWCYSFDEIIIMQVLIFFTAMQLITLETCGLK